MDSQEFDAVVILYLLTSYVERGMCCLPKVFNDLLGFCGAIVRTLLDQMLGNFTIVLEEWTGAEEREEGFSAPVFRMEDEDLWLPILTFCGLLVRKGTG